MRLTAVAKSEAPTPRTPARTALAVHLEKIRHATAAVATARAPADRLRAAVDVADADLKAARSSLEAVDIDEAGDLARWARQNDHSEPQPSARAGERDQARERVTEAERVVAATRRALAEADAEAAPWKALLATLAGQTTQFVLAVLVELSGSAMSRLQSASAEFLLAEADAISFAKQFGAHGRELTNQGRVDAAQSWFRAGETAVAEYRQSDRGLYPPSTDRWARLIVALATDADAVVDD